MGHSRDEADGLDDLVEQLPGPTDKRLPKAIFVGAKAVWMQSGIRNDEAARRLAEAGIKVRLVSLSGSKAVLRLSTKR